MKRRFIVGMGLANIDYLATVPHYPAKDTKNFVSSFTVQGGGPIATAIAAAARLGEPTRLVTKIGGDDFGRQILQGLATLGVDLSKVVVDPEGISPYSFVVVDESDASRTLFHWRDLEPLQSRDVDWSCLDDAVCFVSDCRSVDAQIEAARRCRAAGIPVLLDVERIRDGVMDMIALADILIVSQDFAALVLPGGTVEERITAMRRLGPRVVVVTLGEKGSVGMDGTRLIRQPAFAVRAIDTTGCGDVYHGGFAVGVLRGYSVERCMQLASAAAALSCRAVGGRAALPAQSEVEQLIAKPGFV
jgi:sulfofructose kinase